MNFKILATGDIHIGVIDVEKFINKELPYLKETFLKVKPNILLLNGDLTEWADNLITSSKEGEALSKLLTLCRDLCIENKCLLRIIEGTKSHDGKNTYNLMHLIRDDTKTLYNNIPIVRYIDIMDREVININNEIITIGYLPEPFYSTYDDFLNDFKAYINNVDVLCFHGMLDVAIPQLKQINSQYNLARSMVIQNKDLLTHVKYVNICSHVHMEINYDRSYYINTFTAKPETISDTGIYGLKEFIIKDKSFDYITHVNPYAITNPVLEVRINKERDLGDLHKFIKNGLINLSQKHNCKLSDIIIVLYSPFDIQEQLKVSSISEAYQKTNIVKLRIQKEVTTRIEDSGLINIDIEKITEENLPKLVHDICKEKLNIDLPESKIIERLNE